MGLQRALHGGKTAGSSRGKRNPSLDGLRAVAIALVVVDHASAGRVAGDGVSIFLVLSGFMITQSLMGESDRFGRLNVRLFYLRRLLRLYPALLVAVGCTLVATATRGAAASAIVAVTYTTDLVVVTGHSAGLYAHTWSLALQEQFYLLWPLVFVALFRRRKRLAAILVAAIVASLGFEAVGIAVLIRDTGHIGPGVLNPIFQMHALLIGCVLAIAPRRWLHRRHGDALAGCGLAVIVLVVLVASFATPGPWIAGWDFAAEIAAAAVIVGLTDDGTRLHSTLARRVPVWVGQRSYGIFLWHVPLLTIALREGLRPMVAVAVAVPCAVVAAALTYRYVEAPLLSLQGRLRPSESGPGWSPKRRARTDAQLSVTRTSATGSPQHTPASRAPRPQLRPSA